ncbi:HD domain-containing phosphohydrolase [Desulfococcus sp.]|uniref:HD domain-containing phosphohydrolase n=1 Tax=Desulfococcus sp. TaxID=2025834 RepID=UPI00359312B1
MTSRPCDNTLKILVADDDPNHLEMVSLLVRNLGYPALTAEDGQKAWEIFQEESPRIVVTDWVMPRLNGLDLCRKIREAGRAHYTYLIILSGQNGPQDAARGLAGGIDDYVMKPFKIDEFQARIEIGVRIVRLETELACRYEAIRKNYFQTIRMFSNLIEVYDRELGGHSRRVAALSLKIGKRHPEISEEDLELLEAAALLKEIGMIGLPAAVFSKRRVERTGEEGMLYRSHPEMGEIILKEIEFLRPVAALVRAHHEQFNGLGFPDGLGGEEIPVPARIISGATVYDNLLYRGNFDDEQVVQKLMMMRGFQLDPKVVSLILELHKEAVEEKMKNHLGSVALTDLAEGMRLAKDFHGATGALLLPANIQLNRQHIEKLKKHQQLTGLTDKVYIYASF